MPFCHFLDDIGAPATFPVADPHGFIQERSRILRHPHIILVSQDSGFLGTSCMERHSKYLERAKDDTAHVSSQLLPSGAAIIIIT